MKQLLIRIAILLALVVALCVSVFQCRRNAEDSQIYLTALNSLQDTLKVKRINRTTFQGNCNTAQSSKQFSNVCPSGAMYAKKNNIKVKRILTYGNLTKRTRDTISAKIDTVFVDSVKVQAVHFENEFYRIDRIIQGGQLHADISSSDSLQILVYKEPKRFLFIKYGVKAVKVIISPKNPNTQINSINFCTFEK